VTQSKVRWPKLVEGRTYRYTIEATDGRAPIVRMWTVGAQTSMDSAAHFRQAVARWTRRGGWTVKVEPVGEAPEAPVSPVEPRESPEATEAPSDLPDLPESLLDRLATMVGTLERIEDGYAYVSGCPQALRPGHDIEPGAQVGDLIEYAYGRRSYGGGYYGKILK
jgi:hypothetical protein